MIIGIDPGINKTHGVVLVDNGHFYGAFSIKVPSDTKKGREVMYGRTKPQYIADELEIELAWLSSLAKRAKVFIEEPVAAGAKNLRTAIQMGRACGGIEAALGSQGLIPHLVPVDSWKKTVLGKGGLNKEAIKEWVSKKHPDVFKTLGGNQDLCDAYCIARYGMVVTEEVDGGGAVHPNTHSTHRSVGNQELATARERLRRGSLGNTDVRGSESLREPFNSQLAPGSTVR